MRKVSNAGSNEARRRLAQVVADGVVAAYLHAISDRHAAPAAAEERASQLTTSDRALRLA